VAIVPDFYNWNRVKLRYCDGASFTGNKVFNNEVIFHNFLAYVVLNSTLLICFTLVCEMNIRQQSFTSKAKRFGKPLFMTFYQKV
jgi:hypothetical protein